MDAKIVKLDSIEKRYLEIGEEMLKEDVVSNVKAFTKLSKEQATLKGAYDAYQEYKKLNSDIIMMFRIQTSYFFWREYSEHC